ncbi:MAG: PEGA domain-containing protein [Nitrospirae bacterium]|nr:PEGA domain-containing protein [Nitrospirota bacterium]
MKRLIAYIVLVAMILNGCAYGTLIHGSKQEVLFNSHPEGAEVSVDGAAIGKTPVKRDLPRGKSALVEFNKTGCERKQVLVFSYNSPIVFANLIPFLFVGFFVGTVIDLVSGGAYYLDPDPVYASLECAEVQQPSQNGSEGTP